MFIPCYPHGNVSVHGRAPAQCLAQEVYGEIFSYLNQQDLFSCAVVCLGWLGEADYRLWRVPVVKSKGARDMFFNTLTNFSPSKAHLVRGLRLMVSHSREKPWLQATLRSLPRLLPHITSLSIKGLGPLRIDPDIPNALTSLRSIESLELLHCLLYDSTALPDLVLNLRGLRRLRLDSLGVDRGPGPLVPLPPNPAYQGKRLSLVQKLIVRGVRTQDVADWLFGWLADCGCRPAQMEITHIHSKNLHSLGRYLGFVGSALRAFIYRPIFAAYTTTAVAEIQLAIARTVDLQHNSNLNILDIQCDPMDAAWVPELLETVRRCPLRRIAFTMTLPQNPTCLGNVFGPWPKTLDILKHCWKGRALCKRVQVVFAHRPMIDESIFGNTWLLRDGRPEFEQYFSSLREFKDVDIINVAPIDLTEAYSED